MWNHRAAIRKEWALGAQRIDGRTGRRRFRHVRIRHAAMMFAIAAAAGGQIRLGVNEQRGANRRKAEQ
jgi:hypothetical protein